MSTTEHPRLDCYQPNPNFMAFMKERLLVLTEQDKLQGEKPSRGRKVDEWNKRQEQHRKAKRISDKNKVKYLNKTVFPSMANVVYFLEEVSRHPELMSDFDNDIKDLLGFRYEQKLKHKGFMPPLRRFIEAALTWDNQKNPINFRLAFIEWIQYILFMEIRNLALLKLGSVTSNGIIDQDMGRAVAWSQILARPVKDEDVEPSRPVRF